MLTTEHFSEAVFQALKNLLDSLAVADILS